MMLKLMMPGGDLETIPQGSNLLKLSHKYAANYASPIAEGIFNGKEVDLQAPVMTDGKVEFVELNGSLGMRVFVRTLLFLCIVAFNKLRPDVKLEVRNSLGSALYLVVHSEKPVVEADLERISALMHKYIADKEVVHYQKITREEARACSVTDGNLKDREGLLDMFPERQLFTANELLGYKEYFFGALLPTVEFLAKFELIKFEAGFVINYPATGHYDILPSWNCNRRINEIYNEAEAWSAMINCNTVAKLNKVIKNGQVNKIIQVSEALQEKKIAQIADKITANIKRVKMVLIAGPSSSGKTSFAQRLSIQLGVNGIKPIPLSMDNYYRNRVDTPRKPDGSYDFECVEAIDIPLFNEHLQHLLNGEFVKLPKYNFRSGVREYRGEELQLVENGVLVIEGIHGLNEALTASIPADNKMKIFISALSPLSLDDYNRIHTTDVRLLRRIVRDSQFRSHDAGMTLKLWASVREGEEKYIFPFQEDADIFFNTSLIYEIAVLKKYAVPLLQKIKPVEAEFTKADYLLRLLNLCETIEDESAIPNNSIMKEFLGGSIFKDAL
jgi:uridine kinase